VLWEHKRLASARTRRLAGHLPALVEQVERVERAALSLRNAMVRDRLRAGRSTFAVNTTRMLNEIRTAEQEMLRGLLAALG
jgi:hypothetical protein